MEKEELDILKSKDPERVKAVLDEFNSKNANLFNFEKFHTDGQWLTLWRIVFELLTDDQLQTLHPLCLNTVRILTRDEFALQTNDIKSDFCLLLELARLTLGSVIVSEVKQETENTDSVASLAVGNADEDTETVVEALKCLCNLVFQSHDCRKQCVRNRTVDFIMKRVTSTTQYSNSIEFYDMNLLFLITALELSTRPRVQIDLNGIVYLTKWLDDKLVNKELTVEDLKILCEVLKVLFNITTNPDKSPNENEIQSLHLTSVVRELIIRFGEIKNEQERAVVFHCINLLTNMSSGSLTELVVKCETTESSLSALIYEDRNVLALDIILRCLRIVLEETENTAASNKIILPVLTVLVKCARCNPVMRHYIRTVILPPLRDVSQLPEVGKELRNYLCRFLTVHATMIRDLSAELLFICCKENVGRMIKYTGYGNAAGLLASRGLLDCRRVENAEYSSDSEDSDTEEYKQAQSDINVIIGRYEPPKKNPLEGMSEEQKEHEAMELANLIEKLHNSGIVKPCRIGEDGKPQPIDHILQLQEELPQQQLNQKHKS
ncbi:synembryn [Teleopsis dalmanni]|uniref:synembryn n=1 Tax=Teleopsis dalmanni TaxID=139649 RepID=UPI0018CFDD82|nr:synembryn [Teleopsis dalmanni]